MILEILTVAGLATFEIYAAIPAGFAFGLSPWTIFFAAVTGGLVGVFIATFLGDKIKKLLYKNKQPKKDNAQKYPFVVKIWEKYGIIGLGFLGTMIVGAPISIAIGTGLNADLRKLLVWCCIGVVTRCILFTFLGDYITNIVLAQN
jgi:membrane protein YqaA with SNARE-associated domain